MSIRHITNWMIKVLGTLFTIGLSSIPVHAALLQFSYETIDAGGNKGNGSFLLDTAISNSNPPSNEGFFVGAIRDITFNNLLLQSSTDLKTSDNGLGLTNYTDQTAGSVGGLISFFFQGSLVELSSVPSVYENTFLTGTVNAPGQFGNVVFILDVEIQAPPQPVAEPAAFYLNGIGALGLLVHKVTQA